MCASSSYSRALEELDANGTLPENFAAFTIDINGLKAVNDSLGHEAGDELIRGAATCVKAVLGDEGQCYRTGGDEFVMLTRMKREKAEYTLQKLKYETERWQGSAVKSLSVSVGYALASDADELTAEALVRQSDQAMYEAKAAYYQSAGRKQRSKRRHKSV